jgi:hypothetical protein
LDRAIRALETLQEQMREGPPGNWPGGCDPSLGQPDRVKFELATFATQTSPGPARLRELEERLSKGVLGVLPELDHWAVEEFLWHGLPGDSWHPVEAFLQHAGARFPPAAREQLRLWKEARIGLFKVGEVADDLVWLHEWDPVLGVSVGAPFRAITLNVGGANAQRSVRGRFLLTHVAPWRPEDGLYCGMGYGICPDQSQAVLAADYLGLRHLAVAATPLPWKQSRSARDEYLRRWQQREWYSWLTERLQFPFHALVGVSPDGKMEIREVRSLLPSTAEQTRMLGIYFEAPSSDGKQILAAGGTLVMPVDITSPNRMALEEYHAYRKLEGPPPGTRGMPGFASFR